MKIWQNWLFLSMIFVVFLAYSNPNEKSEYVDFMAKDIADYLLCEQGVEEHCEATCVALKPVAYHVARGALAVYTEKPKDYILFTTFRSDIPGLKINVIAIGGSYLVLQKSRLGMNVCDLLNIFMNQSQFFRQEI